MKLNVDQLLAYLSGFCSVPENFEKELESGKVIQRRHFARNHRLAEIGETAPFVCFLENGFATVYYRDENDKLKVSRFVPSGKGIIPINFFSRSPCLERIVVHAGSIILQASWKTMKYFFEHYPESQEMIRLIQEEQHRDTEEEKNILRQLSAQEKFEYLLQLMPDVLQYASATAIASYLGISERTIRRIWKNFKKLQK